MQQAIQANVEAQMARLQGFRQLLEGMFRDAPVRAASTARLTLLFASVLKVTQSATAVEMLSRAGCVEEVLALSRTVVEVTVNAAYFQVAADKEVDRFLQFHPESRFQHLGLLEQPRADGFARRLLRRMGDALHVSQAAQADPAWSTRSLMDRARFADEHSHVPVMVPLVVRCYSRGQAAVHGTVASLETFIASVQTMEAPRVDDRMAELTEALFGVNLCLLTLCIYLNAIFHLNLDKAIDEAANAETLTQAPTLEQPYASESSRRFAPRQDDGRDDG